MNERYYIAYGSNLHKGQMGYRCPGATVVGTSEIKGWRLLFKGSGTGCYLTIEPRKESSVPVAIWRVTEEDERSLDHYEGFPRFYEKKDFNLEVETEDGRILNLPCFAYIMTGGRHYGLPQAYYYRTCLSGYRSFGFERSILDRALADTLTMNYPRHDAMWDIYDSNMS